MDTEFYIKTFGKLDLSDSERVVKYVMYQVVFYGYFNDFEYLYQVLANGCYGGVGGDPGWSFDRRPSAEEWNCRHNKLNDEPLDWPDEADFLAEVELEDVFWFKTNRSKYYLTRKEVYRYLDKLFTIYFELYSDRSKSIWVEKILDLISDYT